MEQQAGFLKRFFASRSFVIVGVVVLLLLSAVFLRAYYQNYKVHQEIRYMLDEANRIESKNAELKTLLDRVKQNDYVEEKARTELNMVKEGEKQTVILGKNNYVGQVQAVVVESKRISNPREWWNYFFNHN